MGRLEKEVRAKHKNIMIKKAVLGSIAAAGILSVAMVAPNVLQVLDQLQGKKRKSLWQRLAVDTARRRLIDQKLLKYDEREFVQLTTAGKNELNRLKKMNIKLKFRKNGMVNGG